MFEDDFDYCFWPKDFDLDKDTCCADMRVALKNKGIELLSNWKYFIHLTYSLHQILHCPFCGISLRNFRLLSDHKHS